MKPVVFSFIFVCSFGVAISSTIVVPQCEPPDYPLFGNYGPKEDVYFTGDVIHYYCGTDTHIGGNYYRRCEDTGDWSGEAPVCDAPAGFRFVNQTSTATPKADNNAERAVDGLRSTCFTTRPGQGNFWTGMLNATGELFRVMIFIPKGDVAYEVFMIKTNGDEVSCGKKVGKIEVLNWEFHNCPEPHNTDIVALKIKSLSDAPLQLCEVVGHMLTTPTCVDPRVRIDNGRLELSRKTATLVCDAGYTKSPDTSLNCERTGVWNRRSLYCIDRLWEVGQRPIVDGGARPVLGGDVPDDEP